MSFYDAKTKMDYARNPNKRVKIDNNTWIRKEGSLYIITLYTSDIIKAYPNHIFELYTRGYWTLTTKNRINKFSPALICQHNYIWYIQTSIYSKYPFYEGIKITSEGIPIAKTGIFIYRGISL